MKIGLIIMDVRD